MKTVAVQELQNRLSVYLREVASGEVVLVTDHGRIVAELRRPTTASPVKHVEHVLERLHAEGVLTPGLPQDAQAYKKTNVRLIGVGSHSLLDADRADR